MGLLVRFVVSFWLVIVAIGVAIYEVATGYLTLERLQSWWSWYISGAGWWNHTLEIVAFVITALTLLELGKYLVSLWY
ncbi:MAG: hypothetical protein WC304_02950, partial [Candidatus Gracilibacteria bacterium]